GHEDRRAAGDEHQAVVLGRSCRLVLHICGGLEGDDEDDARAEDAEERGEVVDLDEALEALRLVAEVEAAGNAPGENEGGRQIGGHVLAHLRHEQFEADDADGAQSGDVFRNKEAVLTHDYTTPGRCVTDAATRSVNGAHQTPIATIAARRVRPDTTSSGL